MNVLINYSPEFRKRVLKQHPDIPWVEQAVMHHEYGLGKMLEGLKEPLLTYAQILEFQSLDDLHQLARQRQESWQLLRDWYDEARDNYYYPNETV